MDTYSQIVLYLLRCFIKGEKPSISNDNIDYEGLYELSRHHRVENIIYSVLKQADGVQEESLANFKKISSADLMVALNQEYYLNKISDAFRENGVKYMPLKGSIIKHFYPSIEFRQSSDIDIYIGFDNVDKAREIMENLGFENTLFGQDQDVYQKGYICVELHRTLLPERSKWYDCAQAILARTIVDDGIEYKMTNEDFYLFMIIHIAKHVSEGGMGIRAILDVWIYLDKYSSILDWNKLNQALTGAKMTEFENNIRTLAGFWFSETEPNDVTQILADYFIRSGWNGTQKQKTALFSEDYVNENKVMYIFKYIFKPARELRTSYKYLKRLPWLVPFAWMDRVIKAVFMRKGAVKKFLHRYDGIEADEITELKSFVKNIGL